MDTTPDPETLVPARPSRGSAVGEPAPSPVGAGRPTIPRRRKRLAWALAITVDFIQVVAMPFFVAGGAAPWNDAIDLLTGIAMVRLLGWHVAFVPTFVAELLPFVDLFPTWTVAVFVVSRRR